MQVSKKDQNEEEANVDLEDIDEELPNATWITCAGQLHYLTSKLRASETILNEIDTAESVNEEYFLIRMKGIAMQIMESSTNLLKISSKVLENLERSKSELDECNEDTTAPLPVLDPGERCKRLTENQKKYLIRIGPYQPILQQYPSDTKIRNEGRKQSRFNPSWFKEYPHLEYSLSKDAASK